MQGSHVCRHQITILTKHECKQRIPLVHGCQPYFIAVMLCLDLAHDRVLHHMLSFDLDWLYKAFGSTEHHLEAQEESTKGGTLHGAWQRVVSACSRDV